MPDYKYLGEELELFEHALNWKRYFAKHIIPFLGNTVLEAGAGVAGTTPFLCKKTHDLWVCLDPDEKHIAAVQSSISRGILPAFCKTRIGTLANLSLEETFDSILYIDVLEHIQNDANEIQTASKHLNKDGFLIILSPAHPWLYTQYDKSIGHYRRYTRKSLSALFSEPFVEGSIKHLDSAGVMASLANKLILKKDMPNLMQVLFWDRFIIPVSRLLDPLSGFCVGKSILGIWQKK